MPQEGAGMGHIGSRIRAAALTALAGLCFASAVNASAICPEEQKAPQLPIDPGLGKSLENDVRHPGGLPLTVYEDKLSSFLTHMCHRDEKAGWKRDKFVRDTGPWTSTFSGG